MLHFHFHTHIYTHDSTKMHLRAFRVPDAQTRSITPHEPRPDVSACVVLGTSRPAPPATPRYLAPESTQIFLSFS
jgi:hypothetical protein